MINKNTEQVFLIGFCGKIGSGKSYIASNIVKYLRIKFPEVRVEKMSFAEGVKLIATKDFGWDGQKNKKGRKLLIGIGNDVGRKYNPEIWKDKLINQIKNSDCEIVVVDDVRYDNEAILFDILFKLKKPFGKRIADLFKPHYWSKSESGVDSYNVIKIFNNYGVSPVHRIIKILDNLRIKE